MITNLKILQLDLKAEMWFALQLTSACMRRCVSRAFTYWGTPK